MGDADLDGFPILLLITEGHVHLLLSVPYACSVLGYAVEGMQCGWRKMNKGVEPLMGITDARIVVFINLDKDVTLDVMVQHTGEQGARQVFFSLYRTTFIPTPFL